MEKATGAATKGTKRIGKGGKITRSNGATASQQTLADLGISKDQSSRWQQLADIPEADFEAERRACEIRLRAERKAGQLLRAMEKAKGRLKRGTQLPRSPSGTAETLRELGISKQQSAKWQQLADIPEADFEAALAVCARVDIARPGSRGVQWAGR